MKTTYTANEQKVLRALAILETATAHEIAINGNIKENVYRPLKNTKKALDSLISKKEIIKKGDKYMISAYAGSEEQQQILF